MAPQPSMQFNQILGDGAKLSVMKKGAGKGDTLLNGDMSQGDVFRNLLSGLVKTTSKSDLTALVTKVAAAKKLTDSVLQITPEFLSILKNLTPDELNKMPPELAALIVKQLSAETALDSKSADLLQTLSAIASSDDALDMFKIIEDPKLAAFLAGLPHAQTLDNTPVPTGPLTEIFTIIPAASVKTPVSSLPTSAPVVLEPNEDLLQQLTLLPGNTITIADLDGDGFQALKKLAFADIAPYLTMPRTVRLDSGAVMKVAQGPSFLNEDNTESALMAAIAGLMPVVPPTVIAPATPGLSSQMTTDADAPVFLDASVLTTAQTQNSSKPAKPTDMFAALLGVRVADGDAPAKGQTTAPQAPVPVITGAETKTAAQPSATALLQAASQQTAAPHIGEVLKGLDHQITTGFTTDTGEDFAIGLRLHADASLPASATNVLTAARSAATPHPATHMVSVALQRMSAEGENQITIHLDPGSLGKIKITLEFGENNTLKAKLLAERPETISLLQKDSVQLERALQNSGFDTNRSSLTFDLAQGDTFSGAMNGQQQGGQNGGSKRKSDDGTDFATIETVMPIYVDPQTGLTHVNVVV